MAYGSPERLADVPAYYADIRGGRPIAPSTSRISSSATARLGVEEARPLNAITEATRAALEAELGLPVFTGMKHWTPRIAEAAEQALAAGADRDRRARARAALLGALDRRLPAAARGGARRPRRAPLRRELARRARVRRAPRRQAPRHGRRTSSSPRTGCRRGSSTRATRTATQLHETARLVAEQRRRRRLVVLLPERLADRRAVARAGHPRPPRDAARARRRGRARLPDRLRLRPPRDPLGHRRRGAGARRASSGCGSSGSRCRTPSRRSSTCSPGSSGGRRAVPSQV